MSNVVILAIGAALLAGMAPTLAKIGCDAGFKNFMSKMTIYVDKISGDELAHAVHKSLDAYNSCEAGDTFSPHGVWDQIRADMSSPEVQQIIQQDIADAAANNVQATPEYFVNGRPLPTWGWDQLVALVSEELARSR